MEEKFYYRFRLTKETHKKLRTMAADRELNMSVFVEKLIHREYEESQSERTEVKKPVLKLKLKNRKG